MQVKRRFEDYLAQINNRTKQIDAAAESLAQDTAILLEAMERSLKAMARVDELVGRVDTLREQTAATVDELFPGLMNALDTYDRRSADRLEALRERLESSPASKALLDIVASAPDGLTWRLTSIPVFPESVGREDIEMHLCSYLAGLVSDRHAIDVGAHRGRYSQALADQGMTVLAIEPNPALAQALRNRFSGNPRIVVRDEAAGDRRQTAPLYVASDTTDQESFADTTLYSTLTERPNIGGLRFDAGPNVEVATVDELRQAQGWGTEVGLVKIDVEGLELAVISGLGQTRPETLMFEFWGPSHPLVGSSVATSTSVMIDRILDLGYRHWLSVIHDDGQVGFALGNREVPPRSWGNYLCFQQHETFVAAVRWCGASMPEMIRTVGGTKNT